MDNINTIMSELAKYNALMDETAAIIDGLKDEIKAYMVANNLDTLQGIEHEAIYKSVSSTRIDTKALKNELPEIATRYSVTSNSMRFTFA